MTRPLPLALGVVLALGLSPSSGHAQLGGLVKKAKDRVNPSSNTSSVDQPARLPGPEVTPDLVDHLLAGLKAERTEAESEAADARRRKDQDDAARNGDTRYQQCLQDRYANDPKRAEMDRATEAGKTAASAGDYQKASQIGQQMQTMMAELQQRADSACASLKPGAAPPPKPAEVAMERAEGGAEGAGAKAAGLTPLQYGQVKELVYTYLTAGNRAGLADSEKHAIDARRAELKDALQGVHLQ